MGNHSILSGKYMATARQRQAARANIRKAQQARRGSSSRRRSRDEEEKKNNG